MFELIKKFARTAMKGKQITAEEIDSRIAEARSEHAKAVSALQAAEAEAAQLAVTERMDEIGLARTDKRLHGLRQAARRWSEQLGRLDVMQTELFNQALEQRLAAVFADVEQLCRDRERVGGELDAWVTQGAKLFKRFGEVNEQVWLKLPSKPSDTPAMFNLRNLQSVLLQRLAGESNGAFRTRGEAQSIDYLKRAPTVAARAAEERQRLLAQYKIPARPTPPAAA